MNKLFSIITPTFNGADKLERCILSVKNQTYKNIEHVIVDGGSNDGTLDIILKYEKQYNLKWISEKDSGIADAMNKGFALASGDLLSWLDADNYYDLNAIELVSKIFNKNNDIDIVYGNVNITDDFKNISRIYRPPINISLKLALAWSTGAIPPQPAVFFKQKIFKMVGGFFTNYKIAGDYDFWVRVLKEKPSVFYINEVFGNYSKNEQGASQSIRGVIRGYQEMFFISKSNGQPLRYQIMMFAKYLRGVLVILIKRIILR